MFNLGPFELVAIFVVALLVFGPDKLPEMGRQVGKAVREFRKFQAQMETNVRDVIDPITGPLTSNGGAMGPQPTNIRDSGTLSGGMPNVPRSATIQNPEQEAGEGEDAPPPGSFGYYAPVDQPQAAPQNGPAPEQSDTADETAAPPERPADSEDR